MKKTICIKGKDYPFEVTMGALLRYERETGHDSSTLNQKSLPDMVTLLWCCVVSASRRDGVAFDLSLEDFADAITVDDLLTWVGTLPKDGGAEPAKKKGKA